MQSDQEASHILIGAISRAWRWVNEMMAGGSPAEIARREGKGERQIRLLMPLAFMPPRQLRELIANGSMQRNVTELAKKVPLIWT